MKRKIEVEVEPLSEARWAKVDEAVFEALDAEAPAPRARPRRHTWWIAGAGIAAAAAAVVVWGVSRNPKDGFVHDPSHIETAAVGSRLALGFATLEVAPQSAVTTSGDDAHGLLVVLEHGAVDCEVAPRSGRPPFVVAAGDVRVRVVGTHFIVRRAEENVRVEVMHGRVEVARAGELVVLHDGESWPSAKSTAVETPAPSVTATAIPSATTTATATAMATATATPARMSDQATYEQAAKSERSDPDSAMAAYKRLAAGGGPWAATSLFAAGRLASERGRRDDARALLEQYVARYPNGSNAEDARRLLAGLR
ncbi:MAG TPA: FecR domain-containing protein [Labilithrix sp.]|jgi:hypothetical protein